jgi:hypothetical protein
VSAVDFTMFMPIARKALRVGIRNEGHKIGLSDLDVEQESLAYALAEVASRRVSDVIAERELSADR